MNLLEVLDALTIIQQTCKEYCPICSNCPLRTESGTRCIFTTEQMPFEWKLDREILEEGRLIK